MNSLLSLTSTPSPASGLPARDAATADPAGPLFASFLNLAAAAAETAPPAAQEASATLQTPADLPLLPGIALPPVAGTGKFLPQDLPLGEEDSAGNSTLDQAADPAATLPFVPPLLMVLPNPELAQVIAGATGRSPVTADGKPGVAASATPAALSELQKALPANPALTPTAAAALALPAGEAPAQPQLPLASPTAGAKEPSVVVSMDAAPAETRNRTPSATGEALATRIVTSGSPAPLSERTDQQPGQTPSKDSAAEPPARLLSIAATAASPFQPTEAPTTALASASAQPVLAPSLAAAPLAPTQPAAMQDLSAIVDRLAAAREALAPATAALTLDHAEFGEMTLRFEQQQDGQLSVGLSASNAEAHRAVAAALAAERNPFGGSDRQNSDSQQQQNSQARANSGPADRGSSSSSGGSSNSAGSQPGSGQARHDSPRQPSAQQARQSARNSETGRGGIYA